MLKFCRPLIPYKFYNPSMWFLDTYTKFLRLELISLICSGPFWNCCPLPSATVFLKLSPNSIISSLIFLMSFTYRAILSAAYSNAFLSSSFLRYCCWLLLLGWLASIWWMVRWFCYKISFCLCKVELVFCCMSCCMWSILYKRNTLADLTHLFE